MAEQMQASAAAGFTLHRHRKYCFSEFVVLLNFISRKYAITL